MPMTRASIGKMTGRAPELSFTNRRLLPVISGFVLLLAVAAATVYIGISSRNYNLLVAHTLRVRSAGYLLLTLVQDAETGQRGYLLTNDPTYLAPYHDGADNAMSALEDLEALTGGSPTEHELMASLRSLVSKKLAELASTVAANTKDGSAAAPRDRQE